VTKPLLLALAVALLFAGAAPAAAVERILSFVSDVVVQRDGDLRVTETIDVQAEGVNIRHGIFRDFPTVYTPPQGGRVEVGFHLEAAWRDGVPETASVENIANGVRIRMGKADSEVTPGRHSYEIRYTTRRQIGFFADYDELYWNATGSGWMFPIDMAEARITLPEAVAFRQTAFYTGAQGELGKSAAIVEERPGYIVFRTTRPLPAHNGLTVAAAWPKGVIEPPSAALQHQQWLEENPGLVIMSVGLLAILAYYGFAWLRVGRDPPTGAIIPLFGPPDGMSPAAVRYVDDMAFDDQCFTAAIVNLGVKGHLRIVEESGKSRLEQCDGGAPLTPEEQALAYALFRDDVTLKLEQANHALIGKAKTGLGEALAKRYGDRLFSNNYLWSGFGLMLVLLVLFGASLAMGALRQFPPQALWGAALIAFGGSAMSFSGARRVFGSLWLILLGFMALIPWTMEDILRFPLPLMLGAAALAGAGGALAFVGARRAFGGRWLLLGGLALLGLAAVGAPALLTQADAGAANLAIAGMMAAAGALAGAGFPWLEAPSREGRNTMDRIEGFREYLSVAESDRLDSINQPKKTPELFERFLPYAIALDCQNAWAAKFAEVLAAAGVAGATNWYVSDRGWSGDPVSFSDRLGSKFASTLSTSATAPGTSSGSGGGGSSGGGGGGGGGGGW
jgi:uncharacterized membrane protein YgcG